ncbi:hypothetical protein WSK_4331 [Novosphingobium sp. Rr 2-17]|uniref:hypothetical protein n=1 Tax=Novosphingobium sp. Rr 2-17 TaxID=555793 RepID=UPI0002697F26|nr:hypothetical protein [Novosphingobium sp. Rr 2-17]EIZ77108.1 hypothetical protein WSK_4331 [Novosphingobium sp. Rr 2-17]
MFEGKPSSRADLKSGTLYAVSGEARWIYYGQVNPDKRVGFFRRRDRDVASPADILSAPLMAVIAVGHPSITRALRSGAWSKLGRFELVSSLKESWPMVQWSVGTLVVGVSDGHAQYDARVEDPAIQNMEIMASWDAEHHIPERLTADFGTEEASWHVGGPVWRQRRVKEEYARRFPDAPWHQLPSDWVQTNVS